MNAKDFIKSRLTDIFNKIKLINIRYEYSEFDDTHMVEVMPASEYNENELYKNLERDLFFDFNEMFFPSTILFVTEGSLNEITSPEFVLMGDSEDFPVSENNLLYNWIPVIEDEFQPLCEEDNYSLAA